MNDDPSWLGEFERGKQPKDSSNVWDFLGAIALLLVAAFVILGSLYLIGEIVVAAKGCD